MAAVAADEAVELKFRLYDGTDIGPTTFGPATTVLQLKESILSQYPTDKVAIPRTVNDLKLINAGKVLENGRTLAESRVPVGEIPGGVITMHVVVRLNAAEKTAADNPEGGEGVREARCGGCSIL
eukprot:jgi/Mesen1/3935/ME000209S02940